VNVDDTARLHVAALLGSKIQSERISATAGEFNWADVIAIMRKLRPNNAKFPDALNNDRCLLDYVLSTRVEQTLLGFFALVGFLWRIRLNRHCRLGVDTRRIIIAILH
jgi:hypothetical protein